MAAVFRARTDVDLEIFKLDSDEKRFLARLDDPTFLEVNAAFDSLYSVQIKSVEDMMSIRRSGLLPRSLASTGR